MSDLFSALLSAVSGTTTTPPSGTTTTPSSGTTTTPPSTPPSGTTTTPPSGTTPPPSGTTMSVNRETVNEIQQLMELHEQDLKIDKSSDLRMIQLNENTRKRRMHFTYMVLIWVAAFLLIICLLFVCKMLPEWFPCKLFIWLIIMAALFMTLYLYRDLSFRDNMDYDRLSLTPPNDIKANKNLVVRDISNNDYDFSLGNCSGSDCCEVGTYWDRRKGKCTAYDASGVSQALSSAASDATSTISRLFNSE